MSPSGSNFNPRNTRCIPVVKIIAFLELEQKYAFFKGLLLSGYDIIFFASYALYMPNRDGF
jgi:hypothetical protein